MLRTFIAVAVIVGGLTGTARADVTQNTNLMWLYKHHTVGSWCNRQGFAFTDGDIRILEQKGAQMAKFVQPALAQMMYQQSLNSLAYYQNLASRNVPGGCAYYHQEAETFLRSLTAPRPF